MSSASVPEVAARGVESGTGSGILTYVAAASGQDDVVPRPNSRTKGDPMPEPLPGLLIGTSGIGVSLLPAMAMLGTILGEGRR